MNRKVSLLDRCPKQKSLLADYLVGLVAILKKMCKERSYGTEVVAMTDEQQNSVTPEWLESWATHYLNQGWVGLGDDLNKAAQALRAEREKRERAELSAKQWEEDARRHVQNADDARADQLAAELTAMKESADMYERHWKTVGDKYRQEQEKNRRQAQEIEKLHNFIHGTVWVTLRGDLNRLGKVSFENDSWGRSQGSRLQAVMESLDALSKEIEALSTTDTAQSECQHEWVDADNEVVTNAEMCRLCLALRPKDQRQQVREREGEVDEFSMDGYRAFMEDYDVAEVEEQLLRAFRDVPW